MNLGRRRSETAIEPSEGSGRTVRPSRKIELAIIVAVSLILTTFALVCSHAGHPFQIFALMYLVSGHGR